MLRLLTSSFFILLLCGLFSCSSTNNILGTYRSKFAVNGFFGTRVILNADSTFTYRMKGDLVYDTAAGQYQIHQRLLVLNYKSLAIDTSSEYNFAKESIPVHEVITGNFYLHEPTKYLIGHHRLFLTDKNDLKVKRHWGYSKCKKYILFGKHWYMRRYYLKQVR